MPTTTVNGLRFFFVDQGHGTPVVLLHGFPEFWYAWRHQIPALAGAGFRVIAPDMRGYNLSAKPPGVRSYQVSHLVDDVAGLVRHTGAGRACIVGHDWGGSVAWQVPMRHPGMVERLVVLAAPHPAVFQRGLARPAQLLKSWYIFFFQLPWLPEATFRAGGFSRLARTLRDEPVHRGAYSEADIEHYVRALAQPGALTAAINYYRAGMRYSLGQIKAEVRPITVPTLVLWGDRDRYLGSHLTEGLEDWVSEVRVVRIADASHWIQNDVPDRANALLLEFLGGARR